MEHLAFRAPEYRRDGTFNLADFEFRGNAHSGWEVLRNGRLQLETGPGFSAVRTRFCGICSTDLARRFMPFSLPQIIGHEVVATRDGRPVVVEINASHHARGHGADNCGYCSGGLDTQCPDRLTLGIDRLPGGFAPWLLAPAAGIIDIPPEIDPVTATLTEPLAAALHALSITPPQNGDRVAVLGPRRLGMLLIAALYAHRKAEHKDFEIVALARHPKLLALAGIMGADRLVDFREAPDRSCRFDIVFDTTGSPDGFEQAMALTRRVLHLKSTHGKPVLGIHHLSEMVVDELALLPLEPASFSFHWPGADQPSPPSVFVADSVPKAMMDLAEKAGSKPYSLRFEDAWPRVAQDGNGMFGESPFPRFDLAVVTEPSELDRTIRPVSEPGHALIRPRGAILLTNNTNHPLFRAVIERGIRIHTSRCGPFRPALALMKRFPGWAENLALMITHRYRLDAIDNAFRMAADSRSSIKVLIETGSSANTDSFQGGGFDDT